MCRVADKSPERLALSTTKRPSFCGGLKKAENSWGSDVSLSFFCGKFSYGICWENTNSFLLGNQIFYDYIQIPIHIPIKQNLNKKK